LAAGYFARLPLDSSALDIRGDIGAGAQRGFLLFREGLSQAAHPIALSADGCETIVAVALTV
jgi:hypothetical protein